MKICLQWLSQGLTYYAARRCKLIHIQKLVSSSPASKQPSIMTLWIKIILRRVKKASLFSFTFKSWLTFKISDPVDFFFYGISNVNMLSFIVLLLFLFCKVHAKASICIIIAVISIKLLQYIQLLLLFKVISRFMFICFCCLLGSNLWSWCYSVHIFWQMINERKGPIYLNYRHINVRIYFQPASLNG